MRNVLKSFSEVFHFWANKVQPSGRVTNASFDGDKAYSYRAVIGRHLPDGSVAVCNHRYSNTTSKHQHEARMAARHLTVHNVPYPGSINDSKRATEQIVAEATRKASTARAKRDSYLAEAKTAVDAFNAFATALGYPSEHLTFECTPSQLLVLAAEQKRQAALAKEVAEARKQARVAETAKHMAEWLDGYAKSSYVLRELPVALRIQSDQIETSHGAVIPLKAASRIWKLVTATRAGERDFQFGEPIGHYRLTKIRRDGSMVVGCHDIPFIAIESIAKQLGYV